MSIHWLQLYVYNSNKCTAVPLCTYIYTTHTQYINQLNTAIISEASCRYFEVFTI